jgi:hypothetical protein
MKRKIESEIRLTAKSDNFKPSSKIDDLLKAVPENIRQPKRDNLLQIARRVQKASKSYPPNPKSALELVIPDSMKFYGDETGKHFI